MAAAYSVNFKCNIKKHELMGDDVVTKYFFTPRFEYDNLDKEKVVAIETVLHEAEGKLLAIVQAEAGR